MGKQGEYLDKIVVLFQQYGVRGLTMEQIAAKVGVTKRTLYNHYADKGAMVCAILDAHIEESIEGVNKLIARSGMNAVTIQTALMEYSASDAPQPSTLFIKSVYENMPEIFHRYDTIKREQVKRFFRQNIERGRSEGLYHTDFDVDVISEFIFRVFDSMINEVVAHEGDCLQRSHFLQVVTCLMRGLVTARGSEILERELLRIKN